MAEPARRWRASPCAGRNAVRRLDPALVPVRRGRHPEAATKQLARYPPAPFSCPPLIERTFLLRCLGNNAFEYLAKSRRENDDRWAPGYCKEGLRTPD